MVEQRQIRVEELTVRIITRRIQHVKFNETLLHVINLFRVRPIDRALVIAMFKAKAIPKGIDLNGVLFLNTRDDSIY